MRVPHLSLTTSKITELAPDQASLNAANKLMKASKWPVLLQGGNLVWGECQGSGSNPYRTVFDHANVGYKCTCPSRKFPCKHVLALMWMYVEDPGPFSDGEVPDWVTDWLGRRRNTGDNSNSQKEKSGNKKAAKSLIAAQAAEIEKPIDPKTKARREAAAAKRAEATRQSIAAGIDDLQQWLEDQLRGGLASFLNDSNSRCRTIAARLVDAKAQALAGRLDELPSRLMQTQGDARLDILIQEFGRIVLLCRAWKANPQDAELNRLVGSTETRESILEASDTQRVQSTWEVVGEQVTTRRDGLVSQATWLMNVASKGATECSRFALLLDFFPASLGRRSSSYAVGEQFEATLAFYPARLPLRAVIAERPPHDEGEYLNNKSKPWPASNAQPLEAYREALRIAPWIVEVPLLLMSGRLAREGARHWWEPDWDGCPLPISNAPPQHIAAARLQQAVGLWDGMNLTLLSAQSEWGRLSYGD